MSEGLEALSVAADTPLSVLYQDDALVVIDKPAGLLVHRSELDRHATRFAVQVLREQLGRRVYPVHRLDKGTSGPLVFTFDAATAGRLGQSFEHQTVHKQYVAIVRGHPLIEGVIEHPLKKRHDRSIWRPDDEPVMQTATTAYRRLAATVLPYAIDRYPQSRYALVRLVPKTGRQHQLRRHMKHIAHPIVGDATYGKGQHNRLFQRLFACHRLLLACVELIFPHPLTAAILTVRAPLSGKFAQVVERLEWVPTVPSDQTEIDLYLQH